MGRIAETGRLPEEIRTWLESELKSKNFTGYRAVTEELNRRLAATGHRPPGEAGLSREAVRRFGASLREKLDFEREIVALAREQLGNGGDGRPPLDHMRTILDSLHVMVYRATLRVRVQADITVSDVSRLQSAAEKVLRFEHTIRKMESERRTSDNVWKIVETGRKLREAAASNIREQAEVIREAKEFNERAKDYLDRQFGPPPTAADLERIAREGYQPEPPFPPVPGFAPEELPGGDAPGVELSPTPAATGPVPRTGATTGTTAGHEPGPTRLDTIRHEIPEEPTTLLTRQQRRRQERLRQKELEKATRQPETTARTG